MQPQIEIKHNIGNTITIPNQLDVKVTTYMADNTNTGVTIIPVDNSTEFTPGSILLLLSSMGADNAEIIHSTGSGTFSFTTTPTILPHNRGDAVQELNFDQIIISKSPTINGIYVPLITSTFHVTQQNTIVFDTIGLSTDFYKVQWKNSLTGLLSDLSDPISVLSYPVTSVANIIFPTIRAMGVSKDDPKITAEFLIGSVDDARKYTDAKLYGIRHAWRQEFEHPIKLLAGTNFVYLPDNIDFEHTDQSLLAARLLIDNILTPYNLRYIDKRSWNQIAFSVMGGTVVGNTLIGATSIVLSSTGDFPASGVAYVATSAFTQTIMQIQYTANDKTTNTLSGVTGIIRNIPDGTQTWSRPTISQPIYYTVFEGKLVFDRIIPDSMQGFNVYIDYYKLLEEVISLYQALPEHYREIYKWYLRYAVKYRKDLSLPSSDPDLKKFEDLVQALFNNIYTGQDTSIITS